MATRIHPQPHADATVFAVGARVLVGAGPDPLPARVLAVTLSGGQSVRYQVAYWDARVRRTVWVEANEVLGFASDQERLRIGFHSSP